jgi:thiamine kinase-like enzyme
MSDVLPRSLVHGDLHPRNIVLRADGSPVIIDWGNACIAPPMLDLANIVAPGSSAWQRYLVAYREAGGPIDAETCERAYWWGHAAASLLELPWAAAHRFDAPRLITRIEAAHDQLARRC